MTYPLTQKSIYHEDFGILSIAAKIAIDMDAIIYGDFLFGYDNEILSLIFLEDDFNGKVQKYIDHLSQNGINIEYHNIFNGFAHLVLIDNQIEIFNDKKDIYPFYSHRLLGLSKNGYQCLNPIYLENRLVTVDEIINQIQNKETYILTNLEDDKYIIYFDELHNEILPNIHSVLVSRGYKFLNKINHPLMMV